MKGEVPTDEQNYREGSCNGVSVDNRNKAVEAGGSSSSPPALGGGAETPEAKVGINGAINP